jgi:hypothetical protein
LRIVGSVYNVTLTSGFSVMKLVACRAKYNAALRPGRNPTQPKIGLKLRVADAEIQVGTLRVHNVMCMV